MCADTLNICKSSVHGNETRYGFGSDDSSVMIPPGYFCTVNIVNSKPDYWNFWVNHTSASTRDSDDKNQIVILKGTSTTANPQNEYYTEHDLEST